MSFKKIPSASTERFRLLISDGLYSNSCAMLATQLNSLITDGQIDEYCVIRVNKHSCNNMQGKKVIIILELDILRSGAQVGQKIREFHIQKDGSVKDRKECMKQARKSSEDDSSESDSQAASNKKTKIEEIENENRQLKEAQNCKICMDNKVAVVFLPCRHLISCVSCAQQLRDCPNCRKFIQRKIKTFS